MQLPPWVIVLIIYIILGTVAIAYLACSIWIVKTQIAAAMSRIREEPLKIPDLIVLFALGPLLYGLGLICLGLGISIDAVGAKFLSLIRRGGRFFI